MPNPQLQTYNPKWRGTIVDDDGGDQIRATNAATWIVAQQLDFLLPSWGFMLQMMVGMQIPSFRLTILTVEAQSVKLLEADVPGRSTQRHGLLHHKWDSYYQAGVLYCRQQ